MKISNRLEKGGSIVTELKEIFGDTVLQTSEGNEIAICMRDDTIELSIVGSKLWYRADMKKGTIDVSHSTEEAKEKYHGK